VPTELRLLFALAGLTVRVMWGGTAGHWAHRPLEPDEYEIMIMAEKTGEPIEFALGYIDPLPHCCRTLRPSSPAGVIDVTHPVR
jgi:hypothetical protein